MRIARIYHGGGIATGDTLTLSAQASNHLIRVLRCREGAAVTVFNGSGGEFSATLINENPKSAVVRIERFIAADRESPLRIVLLQGLSRSEHMDTTIQKATELGVAEIVPVICERSLNIKGKRARKKLERWEQIAAGACEQSGRNVLPVLHEATAFNQAIALVSSRTRLVLDPAAGTGIKNIDAEETSIVILCGPEGGLSDREINASSAAGYRKISMGPRVLRTETAGPALISAVQTLWGDMG